MLRNALKYVFVLMLMVTAFSAAAFAESTQATYDPCTGASGYKAISKVKPPPAPAPTALKVKPWGLTSRFDALSQVQSGELGGGLLPAYAGKGAVRDRTQGLFRSIER